MSLFGREREAPSEKIENVIGATANFNGHLKADGGIRIDGVFEGTVETAGNVIVGEGAQVMADITARNVSVAGVVKGNINATGRLEILATGKVWGDIAVASFLIDEGGFFRGQSVMQGEPEPLVIEGLKEAGGREKAGGPESEAVEQA
ncbi:MAG: polymer-forming cytoskeletal protein [Anaerolineae bacterium]